ncbi:MAG: hypothetical protein GTO62_19805 [Planctomycetales bacterium]|nr:hypothetical protein [Planctomycetales bacterium]NIP71435.1 hypothetical protein [Planctomycetales bacterium]
MPNEQDQDAAVERYLSELLGGYDGGSDQAAIAQPSGKGDGVVGECPAAGSPADVVQADPATHAGAPLGRRSASPAEAAADISGMRALANAAAHGAIATHNHKTAIADAWGKLLLAGTALTTSYILIQLSSSVTEMRYWLALLALGWAGFWGYQFLRLAGRLAKVSIRRCRSADR